MTEVVFQNMEVIKMQWIYDKEEFELNKMVVMS